MLNDTSLYMLDHNSNTLVETPSKVDSIHAMMNNHTVSTVTLKEATVVVSEVVTMVILAVVMADSMVDSMEDLAVVLDSVTVKIKLKHPPKKTPKKKTHPLDRK